MSEIRKGDPILVGSATDDYAPTRYVLTTVTSSVGERIAVAGDQHLFELGHTLGVHLSLGDDHRVFALTQEWPAFDLIAARARLEQAFDAALNRAQTPAELSRVQAEIAVAMKNYRREIVRLSA